jgi:hypothetical protein
VTESPSCICINNTRTRYYSFDHMDDLCQRCPLTLSNVYIYCNNIWVNEFFLDKQHRHIAAAATILSLTSTTDIFASLAFCQISFYQEDWWLIHMLSLPFYCKDKIHSKGIMQRSVRIKSQPYPDYKASQYHSWMIVDFL